MRLVTMTALGLTALTTAGTIAGCAKDQAAVGSAITNGATATAQLKSSTGMNVGRATASDVTGGVRYTFDGMGLPPGTHGIHIHTVGLCDAPGFTTAGSHWNATVKQHGTMNPQGPHEGDLPNLIVGTDGRGTVAVTVTAGTVAQLLEGDGSAIVVHAGPDDLKTDPAGNSGGRIACGVFAAS